MIVGDRVELGRAEVPHRRDPVAGAGPRDVARVDQPKDAAVVGLEEIAAGVELQVPRVFVGRGAVGAVAIEGRPLLSRRLRRIAAERPIDGVRGPVGLGEGIGLLIAADVDHIGVGRIGRHGEIDPGLSAQEDAAVGVAGKVHRRPVVALIC